MHGTIYLGLLRETEQPDLNRLTDLIKLVAALPSGGGVVLVSNRSERGEVKDLILQHRGTAVCDATKVIVGSSEDAEYAAAAGVERRRIFLAPGYRPKGLILVALGATEHNFERGWRPAGNVPTDAPRSVAKPACWEETAPIAEPAAPPFATVTLAPLEDAPANDRGPWHQTEAKPLDGLKTVVHSLYEPWNHHLPFRLYAPLPLNCGGGLNRVFPSQEAADAGLAAFVREVRAILTRPAEKEAA